MSSEPLTILCLDCPPEAQGDPFTGETHSHGTLQTLVDHQTTVFRLAVAYAQFLDRCTSPDSSLSILDPSLSLGTGLYRFNHGWWIAHGPHELEVVPCYAFVETWQKRREQNE